VVRRRRIGPVGFADVIAPSLEQVDRLFGFLLFGEHELITNIVAVESGLSPTDVHLGLAELAILGRQSKSKRAKDVARAINRRRLRIKIGRGK